MGKGWAKGLTAATDPRVANAAAAHRGIQYRRQGADAALPIIWCPRLAYAAGLIATDGCLSGDGRHITFVSKDEDLMRSLLGCVGRSHIRHRLVQSEYGGWAYRGQFSHAALYRWLISIGVMPRKSLRLGAIDVPDEYLLVLVRGLLDGDGSIYTLVHQPTPKTYPNYRYERLWTLFNSASRAHVEWIKGRLTRALAVDGYVETLHREDRVNPLYRLKYGNVASKTLLAALYADERAPRLERKREIWASYSRRNALCRRRESNPHGLAATRP